MNWSIHWILGRDWRGSNPQLPPWQGGALTDWTTIPGKKNEVYSLQILIFFFSSLFIFYVLGHRYSRYPLWIARQSLPTSPMFQSDPKRNQSKVSGPELNHDYISYSDIQIRYRWNRGSGPLISLDHVRIRRPIESSCSWMLHFIGIHRYSFLPPTIKGKAHSESQEPFLFFFSLW